MLNKFGVDHFRTIAINGSHDASVTFIDKNSKIRIYEYERFIKKRYSMFSSQYDGLPYGTNNEDRINFLSHLKTQLYDQNIELILFQALSHDDKNMLLNFFPNAKFEYCGHHESHAYSGLHTSGFDRCLIFSVDGGGTDFDVISMFNIYLYENNELLLLERSKLDVGNFYSLMSHLVCEIVPKTPGDMSLSGKFMGLSGYGKIRNEWIEVISNFCRNHDIEINRLQLKYNLNNKASREESFDLAKTSQHVFETELFNEILPFIKKYNCDVIMVGGCALNVLFNQKLYEFLKSKNLSLFVPPHPNDSGLTYRMYVHHNPNVSKEDVHFSGIELLDEGRYEIKNSFEDLNIKNIVKHLGDGKIIGVIDGYSEVGPRSLGHRSIICYPGIKNMKDTLNLKVKFREWFRPFAPACKIEDKDKYFENPPHSKFMSYAPMVKFEYREKLPAITHVDNTCRLQTVFSGESIFYYILDEMEKHNLIPVILNTSFNIKGHPILTTIEDAFEVLNSTEMDFLIYDNKLYSKK